MSIPPQQSVGDDPTDPLEILGKTIAGRFVVVNPHQVNAIAHARIKRDKVDAHTLAELLRADCLLERQPPAEPAS